MSDPEKGTIFALTSNLKPIHLTIKMKYSVFVHCVMCQNFANAASQIFLKNLTLCQMENNLRSWQSCSFPDRVFSPVNNFISTTGALIQYSLMGVIPSIHPSIHPVVPLVL